MGKDLVAEFISEDFRKSVREVLENALLGVQTDNYQLPLFTKDGRRVEGAPLGPPHGCLSGAER